MDWIGKWNYQVNFTKAVSSEDRDIFCKPQINQVYDFKSLKMTKFEIFIIGKILKIFEDFLKELGFEVVPIGLHQIIIVNKDEFEKKFPHSLGKCIFGFIYIPRLTKERWRFISTLSHELAHLVSFYALSIGVRRDGHGSIKTIRLGYFDRKNGIFNHFNGLNEASTEMFAVLVREKIIASGLVVGKNAALLGSYITYAHPVIFLEKIFVLSGDQKIAKKMLIKSYIDGSTDFFDFIESRLPGTVACLRKMTPLKRSVFKAALAIGGQSLKNDILFEINK